MELAAVGISFTSIMRNIEYMRNKYLRRVGPDNGGFWEIIDYNAAHKPNQAPHVWLGLFRIELLQFSLHQTIRLLLQFHVVIICFFLD